MSSFHMDRSRLFAAVAVCAALLVGTRARAQVTGTQSMDFDRPESWAMKYAASESLLTGFGAPRAAAWGDIELGVEVSNLPVLTQAQRMVGQDGKTEENLNKLPVLVRPRLLVGLPWQLSAMVAYVPPVSINGAQANLLSASVGRPVLERSGFRVGARGYGQLGSVQGDFTCPASAAAAGNDPVNNPVRCDQPSTDSATLRYLGLEASGAYRIDPWGGLEPHLALAVNYMNLVFDVNAHYQGVPDTTRLTTSGVTFSGTAGLAMPLGSHFRVALDAFYSPLTVTRPGQSQHVEGLFNGRAVIEWKVH